jgi:hypothetical protein
MKKEQQIPVSEHLLEGANILVKEFKTPAKFLNFLTECLYWLQAEGMAPNSKPTDQTFFIRCLIEEVLQQWMLSGEDVNKNIASGLKEVYSSVGDCYSDEVSLIIQALGISLKEGGIYVEGIMDEYLLGINTMFKIGRCISNYEFEKSKDLKAA